MKNEITDLKNAFDLNRDILKILHGYNEKTDPHFNLLMQIITRLTSVNNQAMLNNIDLIHQKNVLKQEVPPHSYRTSNSTWRSMPTRSDCRGRSNSTSTATSPTSPN